MIATHSKKLLKLYNVSDNVTVWCHTWKKHQKQCLSGGCVMGTYLTFNCTYLVSAATYYCKLSYKIIPMGTDHSDICLAGVWLHKEQFLCTSSIVMSLYSSFSAPQPIRLDAVSSLPQEGLTPRCISSDMPIPCQSYITSPHVVVHQHRLCPNSDHSWHLRFKSHTYLSSMSPMSVAQFGLIAYLA